MSSTNRTAVGENGGGPAPRTPRMHTDRNHRTARLASCAMSVLGIACRLPGMRSEFTTFAVHQIRRFFVS
eukprot:1285502-Rhodomonas_salina.3